MRRFLKWAGFTLGGLVLLLVIAGVAVYMITNAHINTTYAFMPEAVPVSADSATVAKGEHIAVIRGCVECHGAGMEGRLFIDVPPLGKLYATNLTAGEGGVGGTYTDQDWVRAIRHGIGPDDKPLLFMPSHEFNVLSDEDVGALIAYIRALPPTDNVLPASTVGPLARVLYLAGEFPLLPVEMIDHERVPPAVAPPAGPTAEYGAYLATSCMGCHGHGMAGGPITGGDPSWPPAANLTPDPETGIGNWTAEDFTRALREGVRPDGTELDPAMPWKLTAQMSDEEILAIYTYLRSLPAKPLGSK